MKKHNETQKMSGKQNGGTSARNEILQVFTRDYGDRAFRAAYMLSGNVEDARDLVQEAYYRVIRTWDTYDRSQSLPSWFFTILRNIFVDSHRKLRCNKWVAMDTPVDDLGGACYGDILKDGEEADPALFLEQTAAAQTLRHAFMQLRAEDRAIVELYELAGVKYKEIAQRLNIPVGTVRSRLFRARRMLRNHRELAGST